MKAFTTVAIDGAAASGKTTTAKIIAQKYDFMRISTGEYYRALTYVLLEHKMSVEDEHGIKEILSHLMLDSKIFGNKSVMLINGVPVPENMLRSTEINNNVARFSKVPCVREFLLEYQRSQRQIAKQHSFHGLIAEGRDICSVIFPDADLRFLLFADLDKREQRRNQDQEKDCISHRDSIDTHVTKKDDGIIAIDTGIHDLKQVEAIISQYVEDL